MTEIFIHPVRVYYQDTDAGGIVYHADYLRFAERGRTEALREMGIPHAEMVRRHGVMFVVRKAEIDYQASARIDDELRVETRITGLGGASATLCQEIRRDSDSLAVLRIGLACVRGADGRPARMPEPWRARLLAAL